MPKKIGRPRDPNEAQLKDSLCERVANGNTRLEACQALGIEYQRVGQWMGEDERFAVTYARARVEQAHHLADQSVTIARTRPEDMAHAAGLRLQVDTIKWLTSKLAPKMYGEKIMQEHTHRVGVVVLPGLPDVDKGRSIP